MTNPYGATTDPDHRSGGGQAQGRKVTNIRVGDHSDEFFDRVVFDLSEGGDPGWHVSYVDGAHRQGSGDEMTVPGSAVLAVILRGIDYLNEDVEEYDGSPIDGPGNAIHGTRWDGSFEGDTQVFIGTAERLPFRVAHLDNPPRVYIDVVHPR